MELALDQPVDAPIDVVWDVLADFESQPKWMRDAIEVRVVSHNDSGVGAELEVPTNLLGITVMDRMVVTRWEPPAVMEVEHTGWLIRGIGRFELSETGSRTNVRWIEEIDPPLGAVGRIGAKLIVLPVTRWIFTKSLRNLRDIAQTRAVDS